MFETTRDVRGAEGQNVPTHDLEVRALVEQRLDALREWLASHHRLPLGVQAHLARRQRAAAHLRHDVVRGDHRKSAAEGVPRDVEGLVGILWVLQVGMEQRSACTEAVHERSMHGSVALGASGRQVSQPSLSKVGIGHHLGHRVVVEVVREVSVDGELVMVQPTGGVGDRVVNGEAPTEGDHEAKAFRSAHAEKGARQVAHRVEHLDKVRRVQREV